MNIGSFGFPADQLVKLEKMLKMSKNNRYTLVDYSADALPDLLLVFGEDSIRSDEMKKLPRGYHSRLILVSKDKPDNEEYAHIGYPLVSSRVVRILDQMTHENEELSPEDLAHADDENVFRKYDAQIAQVQQMASESTSDRTGFKILVVDDSRPMQQALAKELADLSLPVNIDFADCGEDALTLVENNQYDFLFLDIIMPGIDGFETCTRMRARPDMKKTPIIMLSSKNSPLDEVKGIMAGCSTYLTKPIVHEEFQKVINRVSTWVDEFKPK